MSSSVSTLLARAHRRKVLATICTVTTPACLEAVLLEAQQSPDQVIIRIDTTKSGIIEPMLLLDYAVHSIFVKKLNVPIIVHMYPSEKAVEDMFAKGISAISFTWDAHHFSKRMQFLAWVSEKAHKIGVEVIGDLPKGATPLKLHTFVEGSGIAALCLDHTLADIHQEEIVEYISEVAKMTRIPLLLPIHGMTSKQQLRIKKMGVSAVMVEEYLQQSYTAGLRSALRNREATDVALFEKKAASAVTHSLHVLLENS